MLAMIDGTSVAYHAYLGYSFVNVIECYCLTSRCPGPPRGVEQEEYVSSSYSEISRD